MAIAIYLEHYLDSLEGLPFELQRNFSLMTDLDNRTEEKKVEIDDLVSEYMECVRNLSAEDRVELLKRINGAYSKCLEFSDDKVQLAMQIYELVDKHIRRLDADLARFENELKDKLEWSGLESSDDKKSKKKKNLKDRRGGSGREKSGSGHDSPKHKAQKNTDVLLDVQSSDVLDMPVDPNEPTYCLCAQVSYGEMIGCDNADCPIEWFHFACVCLTTKPKGKWFCPRCIQDLKK
ncbi:inhibitor of growth protein 5-like isoform X1 [Tachysurus fulvidraco]|uniref:inhibitor of growth protein 5-like isoform X1 n=2 Tax=Tachysurus fulvidraco TaxID=1234273 RepID=UPI000F51336D|nr:inhibitor of growth protein 5-like isoform X1 [Tachysurus fulvidraco]